MAVYPIPAGRVSDALLTRRLLSQFQTDQKGLLQVEQQLSTGRRIQLSSEDPSSAGRAVSLQRLLEYKVQLQTNLSSSQSFLAATDAALGSVSGLLAEVRGVAVQAADGTISDQVRQSMALQVRSTIQQMMNIGNQAFRGRYLFGGTNSTSPPFEETGKYLAYRGNDKVYRTFSDVDMLFETNVPGQDLFGAVSSEVTGADLQPILNARTQLADLHGGQGIAQGNIVISDGTNVSTVSTAGLRTVGDLAQAIQSHPPAGRELSVTIGDNGLVIEIDAAGGGNLIVRDVPGGTTAAELGIVRLSGAASDPVVGGDLDPILRRTTSLDDIIAWDQLSGLQITNGDQTYVLDLQSAETVEDLLNIFNGSDAMVLAEINREGTGINVRSRLSGGNFSIGENGGTTASDLGLRTLDLDTSLSQLNYRRGVDAAAGTDFTIRRNDGVELAIDVSSAKTVGDVLDLINNHPDNLDPSTAVVARLSAVGNGIELVDDNPSTGETLTITRAPDSYAAWYLGLVSRGESSSASIDPPARQATAAVAFAPPDDTNTALVFTAAQAGTGLNGIDIELRNTQVGDVATATYDPVGRRLIIDIADGQTTANTVIAAVAAEGTFAAELDDTADPTNDGTGTLVAPAGVAATTAGGTAESLLGQDANPIETEGVFNSLLRLADAIEHYDPVELARIVEMLDADFDRLTFGRAVVGMHEQGLGALTTRNGDEQVGLKATLSGEIDTDFAEAASNFAARQAAYEASLKSIASLYRLSLLDFL